MVILKTAGYSVKSYINPLSFVEEFLANQFSLVLIDIAIATSTGFKLADIIKKMNEKVKICFLTEFRNYYDLLTTEYPNIDYKNYIQKPVRKEDLLAKINELLGN
jgi:two-component SAPR family response regulator